MTEELGIILSWVILSVFVLAVLSSAAAIFTQGKRCHAAMIVIAVVLFSVWTAMAFIPGVSLFPWDSEPVKPVFSLTQ